MDGPPAGRRVGWVRPLAYTAAYALAVVVGRATRLDGTQTALVWPAAGVAVLWLLGSWRAPAARAVDLVLLFAATVLGNMVTGAPLDLSVAFGAANTVQAFAACAVLARCPQGPKGLSPFVVLGWMAIAMIAGTLVGAVVGPATTALVGGIPWPVEPAVWVLRNGVSAFVLVAAVVAIKQSRASDVPPAGRPAEFAAFLLVAALVDAAAFGATVDLPVAFAIVPVGVWAGIRYRVVCASIHNVLMWVIVTAFTLQGRGPFAEHSVETRVILAQAVVAVTAFLTIAIAVSREQERRLTRSLEEERAFIAAVFEQLSSALVIADDHGRLRSFDPAQRRFAPPSPADPLPDEWPAVLGMHAPGGEGPLTRDELPLYRALQGERVDGTEVVVRSTADADERSFVVSASPIVGAAGEILGAVSNRAEVTALRQAEAEAKQHARDLQAVSLVAHQLAAETDLDRARHAVCTAASAAADADLAMLFQPDPEHHRLRCTATADPRGVSGDLSVPLSGAPSGATVVFNSGEPLFVDRVLGNPAANQRMAKLTGMTSVVWQPVVQDGKVMAVLAVGWQEHHPELPPRLASILELLAAEAAVAISRGALIAQLDSVARTDPLTGAHNRRSLDERLADAIEVAAVEAEPLAVLMIDLDHFKAYNDRHGHQQGDRLLNVAVAAWSTEVRSTDTVARYGGEEFAIVLPACGLAAAAKLANRLRLLTPFGQTASIGVAQWNGRETQDELLARADAALYRAKDGGRNRVECTSGAPELRLAG